MLHEVLTAAFRRASGPPAFRAYGRASYEAGWHVIDVFAARRRDVTSRWPFWGGSCICWSAHVVAVGWDFAELLYREQACSPASREQPVVVAGGRLRFAERERPPSASEILAHEFGHSAQVRRMDFAYWPLVGAVTLCREGRHWWNHFENQASATGQFGGLVGGSVSDELLRRVTSH